MSDNDQKENFNVYHPESGEVVEAKPLQSDKYKMWLKIENDNIIKIAFADEIMLLNQMK